MCAPLYHMYHMGLLQSPLILFTGESAPGAEAAGTEGAGGGARGGGCWRGRRRRLH